MKNLLMQTVQLLFVCALISTIQAGRSIHRTPEKTPEITTYWQDDPTTKHRLRDSHLEEGAVFHTFDRKYFETHMLPDHDISYRYESDKSVAPTVLKKELEKLIRHIQTGDLSYTGFVPLKTGEFNTKKRTGFLVVKFKNHPFVAKIFIEEPSSFVDPYCRGFRPMCIYFMSGGIMRHSTGFGRIANIDIIKKHIADNPYWSALVTTPRKWFWKPKNGRWFIVEGKNIGPKPRIQTTLPSVYAIIADEIIPYKKMSLTCKKDARTCLDLCHYCDFCIDPNISNFVLEKLTTPRNKKYTVPVPQNATPHQKCVAAYVQKLLNEDIALCIYDTEHFRTLVGIKDNPFHTSNYVSWYLKLAMKFTHEKFFRTKLDRTNAQKNPTFQYLF